MARFALLRAHWPRNAGRRFRPPAVRHAAQLRGTRRRACISFHFSTLKQRHHISPGARSVSAFEARTSSSLTPSPRPRSWRQDGAFGGRGFARAYCRRAGDMLIGRWPGVVRHFLFRGAVIIAARRRRHSRRRRSSGSQPAWFTARR